MLLRPALRFDYFQILKASARRAVQTAVSNANAACTQAASCSDRRTSLDLLLWLKDLAIDSGLADVWTLGAACDAATRELVGGLAISPPSITVSSWGLTTATLVVRNVLEEALASPSDLVVSWTTANAGIAVADSASGTPLVAEILGTEVGSTTLSAVASQCGASFTAEAPIKVESKVASIEVQPVLLETGVGVEERVRVILKDAEGNELTAGAEGGSGLRWSSDPPGVVAVYSDTDAFFHYWGAVTALKGGRTTVSVTAGGASASLRVNVAAPILVSPTPREIGVGETLTLSATYVNGDPVTASTVSWMVPAGLQITSQGDTTVTVRGVTPRNEYYEVVAHAGGYDASASVKVVQKPKLEIIPSYVDVYVGESRQLTVVATDEYGKVVTDPYLTWSIPACCIAFDPLTRTVRGVTAMSNAGALIASWNGVSTMVGVTVKNVTYLGGPVSMTGTLTYPDGTTYPLWFKCEMEVVLSSTDRGGFQCTGEGSTGPGYMAGVLVVTGNTVSSTPGDGRNFSGTFDVNSLWGTVHAIGTPSPGTVWDWGSASFTLARRW